MARAAAPAGAPGERTTRPRHGVSGGPEDVFTGRRPTRAARGEGGRARGKRLNECPSTCSRGFWPRLSASSHSTLAVASPFSMFLRTSFSTMSILSASIFCRVPTATGAVACGDSMPTLRRGQRWASSHHTVRSRSPPGQPSAAYPRRAEACRRRNHGGWARRVCATTGDTAPSHASPPVVEHVRGAHQARGSARFS